MFFQIEVVVLIAILLESVLSISHDLYKNANELLNNFETYQLPLNNEEYFRTATKSTLKAISFGTFDFIIVGAGTAGSVLANRLTENHYKVLLIEAGSAAPDTSAIVGLAPYFAYSPWNWGYNTTTQRNACFGSINQQCVYHRGKGLGGTSNINAGMYVRGNSRDYDKWEELGNEGWSYKDVLPYFKKSEYANFSVNIDTHYHGFQGIQSISHAEDVPGLTDAIRNGFKELEMDELDYNGQEQLGFSRMQIYSTHNIRSSSNYSFIRPAANRKNLIITLNSLTTKLIIEHKRVIGVEFMLRGEKNIAYANNEVIVSCGSINSPQLLMLSGIGPAEELRKHNIELVADLPVGKNMQDHIMFNTLLYRTNHVYYNYSLEDQLKLWAANKRPLTAGYGNHIVSFFDLNDDKLPDVEIFTLTASTLFGTVLNRASPDYTNGFKDFNSLTDFVTAVMLLHPASVGEVTLSSNDPRDYPLINPNYLSEESDVETIYQGIQVALKLNSTSSFQNYSARLHLIPVSKCDESYKRLSKEWWYCVIRHFSTTVFHPIGTTRMGTEPNNSVVDHSLKVHGIKGLRIVDAGVMPSHIAGHTNAPTVMIAEKAADLIRDDFSNPEH